MWEKPSGCEQKIRDRLVILAVITVTLPERAVFPNPARGPSWEAGGSITVSARGCPTPGDTEKIEISVNDADRSLVSLSLTAAELRFFAVQSGPMCLSFFVRYQMQHGRDLRRRVKYVLASYRIN